MKVYDKLEYEHAPPSEQLKHTDSYEVKYRYYDPRSGYTVNEKAIMFTDGKDAHEAVANKVEAQLIARGKKRIKIDRVTYQ